MKTSQLFALFILVLVLLGGTYYFVRPYFRLPFDQVKIISAVEGASELLIQLPIDDLFERDTSHDVSWEKEQLGLMELLKELKLAEKENWEKWWMVPQLGSTSDQVVFTFIGSSPVIGKEWLPEKYGASLPFEYGDIYTFQLQLGQSIYFARYHNLLLVGEYPFLVENALLAAKDRIASWGNDDFLPPVFRENDIEQWDCLIRNNKNKSAVLKEICSYSSNASVPMKWDWAALSLTEMDSTAYLKMTVSGSAKMFTNISPSSWNAIPPNAAYAFPIEKDCFDEEVDVGPAIHEWLGEGSWTIQPIQAATDTKVSPRIWILPIADSLAYQKFKRIYNEELKAIDRRTYQLFELEQWQDAGFFDGLSDRKLWQPWICELDNVLLLSVYREDLEQYLDYYLSGASIIESESFLQLQEQFRPSVDGEWFAYKYWQSPHGKQNLLEFLYPRAPWGKHGLLLAQAQTKTDQSIQIEGVIQQAPKQTGTVIDWSLAIPTRDPVKLLQVNDSKGQAVAGVIQNTSGQVWAFDEQGNERWQQHIPEPLFEPIGIIDYESGIRRWLGTTPSDVYLWDDNGIDQANYTLKGIRPTSAPIVVELPALDQPLIAFPTKDNSLQLRFLNGKSPENWPLEVEGLVEKPLLYIGQEREDLILAETVDGNSIIANSLGEVLHTTSGLDSSRTNRVGDAAIGNENDSNQWVKAYPDGTLKIDELSAGFHASFKHLGRGPVDDFVALDCWGDNRLDYVVQRGNLVHLFAYEKNQLSERWQYRFPVSPDRIIAALPYGILVLSNERKQIWLLNGEGALLQGFPVGGENNAFLLQSSARNYRLLTLLDRKLYAYTILD